MTRTRTSDDRTITTGTRIVADAEDPRQPVTVAEIVDRQQVATEQRSLLRGTGLRIVVDSVDVFGDLVVLYTPAARVVGNPLKPVVAGPISGVG